jgi:hypothetical protein
MFPKMRILSSSAQMVNMLTENVGNPGPDGWDYRIYIVDGTKQSVIMLFVHEEFDRYI